MSNINVQYPNKLTEILADAQLRSLRMPPGSAISLAFPGANTNDVQKQVLVCLRLCFVFEFECLCLRCVVNIIHAMHSGRKLRGQF